MSLAPGTRLGPYEVLALLGAGGMGEVFRARDGRLNREVALKVLPDAFARDTSRRARFAQEARAAGALNHPGIIGVYDIVMEDDCSYIVSELVDGVTLREMLGEGRLPQRKVTDIGAQVTAALAAAHAAGITHRDLKPENIMVNREGRAKILDFGLARQTASAAAADASTQTQAMTMEGTVIGTVGYMAPEQVRGQAADGRSDIFSVGAVLHEMLSGSRAFRGDTSADMLSAILREDPPELPGAVAPGLAQIVRRCLEKEPAQRFQSAADLTFALRSLSTGTPVQLAPATRTHRGWAPWLVAAALAFAGASWIFHPQPDPLVYHVVPATAYQGIATNPELSPDGKQLAFVWAGQPPGEAGVYVKLLSAGGQPLRVSPPGQRAFSPCWSPDGGRIAYLRPAGGATEILAVPAIGGAERRFARFPGEDLQPMAWSPDGKGLVVSAPQGSGRALFFFSVETGEGRAITSPPAGSSDLSPRFSPDGRWLAFARSASPFTSFFFRIRSDRLGGAYGQPERFGTSPWIATSFDWFADSRAIVVPAVYGATCQYWRLAPDGAAVRLPLELPRDSSLFGGLVSVRGNRMAIAADASQWDIGRLTLDPKSRRWEPAAFYGSSRSDLEPQVSPDGRWVAFRSSRSGTWEIWRAKPDGSEALQISSSEGGRVGDPRWSPGGNWLVYEMPEGGYSHLFVIRAEGGKSRRLIDGAVSAARPSFSADGKWVYFRSERSGANEVWKVPFGGRAPQQVTRNGGHESFESPDGRWLYFIKSDIHKGVFRMPPAGGPEELVIREPDMAAWANAGGRVYLGLSAVPGGKPARILRFDPSTAQKEEIYRFPMGLERWAFNESLAVSRDERTLYHNGLTRDGLDILLVDNFR